MSGRRPWTVIAYIVADDGHEQELNQLAKVELAALKDAGRDEDIRVISYVDFTGSDESMRCVTDGSRGSTNEDCKSRPETNVATAAALRNFFSFARSNAPDNSRYAVLFWGHGVGPAGLFLDPSPTPPRSLTLPDVRRAFHALPLPVDVILFKDCWVSTLEAAYEFDDIAKFMIASQGLVPIRGAWPFVKLLKVLKSAGDPFDRASAKQLLDPLQTHYENADNRGIHRLGHILFSALSLTDVKGRLAQPLHELVDVLKALDDPTRHASRRVMETAFGGDAALFDARTVCAGLQTVGNRDLTAKATALDAVMDDLVIAQTSGTPGVPHRESLKGVSLFRRPRPTLLRESLFETSVFRSNYRELSLSRDTAWEDVAFETLFHDIL